MPYIAIKNHLKLMLRSKGIVIISITLPILVIGALIGAFDSMMKVDYEITSFKVGYRMEENSPYAALIAQIKAEAEKNDVVLEEHPEGNIQEMMEQSTVDVFVEMGKKEYVLYQTDEKKAEAAIVENMIYTGLYQYTEAVVLSRYLSQSQQEVGTLTHTKQDIRLKTEMLKVNPLPSAADYYGIVEVINFTFYLMVCIAMVFASEKRNRIRLRLNVAPTSSMQQYLAKFVPTFLFTTGAVIIMVLTSHFILDVNWGSELGSIGMMFLIALTATAFNLLLLHAIDNLAVSLIITWMLVYIFGFIGGSYEMYMFSSTPESIAMLSPLYYMNRTLVEYSTQGFSDYTVGAVLCCTGITVISVMLTLFVIKRKRGMA